MADQPADRRVRRTKRRLKEALLELIEERDYERITIEEITRRADVGRSTFYSHFADKEDLLFAGFDRWLLSLAEEVSIGERQGGDERERRDHFRFSLPLLRHAGSQKRFLRATIARGSNVRVRRKITALLVEVVRREEERISRSGARRAAEQGSAGLEPEPLRDAYAHAVVGAFLGLLSWWLEAGRDWSAEAVNDIFQDLVVRDVPGRGSECEGPPAR